MKDPVGSVLEHILELNSNEEIQAIFFITLCCLGAWMVLCWIIQIIRSVLWIWPLLIVGGILVAIPSLRITLTQEIIPKRVDEIMYIIDKHYPHSNNTLKWY